MKHLKDQIKFIDVKLLPIYGFKNLLDYSYIINITDTDDLLIDLIKLNELIDEFRKIFHSKNFSLHKTQYKIQTKSQAICLLKTCLEITSIPHDISLKKNKKYLRLISKNNILDNYINTLKMTENGTFDKRNIAYHWIETEIGSNNLYAESNVNENFNYGIGSEPLEPKINVLPFMFKEYKTPETITKKQLNDGIKKIHKYEFYLNPKKLLTLINENEYNFYDNNVFSIDLKDYGLEDKILKSLKIEFISKKINSYPIISEHFISHLTAKLNYIMIIGNQMCWKGQFTGSNCIMDNVLIPINCLTHHQIYFYIINIKELLNVMDNLEIKVDVEYVDLYSELDKKIQSSILEQEICIDNKYNTFRILAGMAGMTFSKYMTKEEHENLKYGNIYKIEKKNNIDSQNDLNDLLVENIGKKISIFNFDGCIVQYDKNLLKLNINDFFKFNDKINFICYDKTYKITNKLSYYKIISDNVFIHNYLINLNTDNNSNLNILPNSISKLNIEVSKINIHDIIEFSFKYKSFNIKIPGQKDDEFTFDENIHINGIVNNYIKINLNNFIPFETTTNIILTIKTNKSNEPIGDEIIVMTREHIFNSNQVKYN